MEWERRLSGDAHMPHVTPGFLDRLKRHHVFRVAAIYAVAAWVLIQASSSILPNLGFPADSVRVVIAVMLLGCPLVLVLAWMFIRPAAVSRAKLSRWKRLRWRLGPALSITVIVLVGISGWYLWQLDEHHIHTASRVATDKKDRVPFNPSPYSIAVLPFANLSNDTKQQYFSDGMAQELTNALGQVPGLQVIAWQSSAPYRDKTASIQVIGRNLGVASILTGSTMHEGDTVRITVELVNTVTGYQLWSSHYDRPFKDVFATQDDISKAVVTALQVKLAYDNPLVRTATANPAAHDAYLKGLAALNQRTPLSLYKAIREFKRATALDSRYAAAYVELARTYTILPESTPLPLHKANAKAKRALQQALVLNPNLPSAHSVLGAIYLSENRPDLAKGQLLRALALNPNDAAAHNYYAFLLPLKDAITQYQEAAKLLPNSWAVQMNLGTAYAELGEYDHALQAFTAAQHLAPENIDAPLEIAFLYHLQSRDDAAVRILSQVSTRDKTDARTVEISRLTYVALQDTNLRNQVLSALTKLKSDNNSSFSQYYLATSYVLLGEHAQAIQSIARFCASIPDSCNDIALDRHYLPLHNDPGFQKLVAEYNIKR